MREGRPQCPAPHARAATHTNPVRSRACRQFVRVFVPRYHDCIRKCRRVGEMGGHQLRVDANAMKIILGAIPMMGAEGGDDEDAGASIMYARLAL